MTELDQLDAEHRKDKTPASRGFTYTLVQKAIELSSKGYKAYVARAVDERVRVLEEKLARRQVDEQEKAASLERRMSRHAEHLHSLEDRMKKVER